MSSPVVSPFHVMEGAAREDRFRRHNAMHQMSHSATIAILSKRGNNRGSIRLKNHIRNVQILKYSSLLLDNEGYACFMILINYCGPHNYCYG